MPIELQVERTTAEKLRQLAEARNVSIDEILATYVPGLRSCEVGQNGVESDDRMGAFDEWVSSFPVNTPPLSDQAISRASIYHDR